MFSHTLHARALRVLAVCALGAAPAPIRAQALSSASLDSLVARAFELNPQIVAAQQRARAAEARIRPAGARPDPMLGVGIQNLPITEPGYSDFMTMNMISLGQTLPYPGKLGLARQAAERDRNAATAQIRAAQLEIAADVKRTYYELVYLDRALEVLESSQKLLVNLMKATETRYEVGEGGQQDVLKARVETARLAEQAVVLAEQRRTQLARLNSLLARESETPIAEPRIPERIAAAAVPADSTTARFRTAALGARIADSPVRPLAELQELAMRNNPTLRGQQLAIDAQDARVDLARKAHLPDFDVSIQYGQRPHFPDMVSATVSVPVPVKRGSRQNQQVAEARAEMAALEAERAATRNRLRADIARAHADAERSRAQLALLARSIIPQGRAARESATVAFQVGRADFLTVAESQAMLYSYETAYFRALADFATSVAELEQLLGTEVLR
ncbi:MAG: TolC family protein [Longimicrobiales bacterium]